MYFREDGGLFHPVTPSAAQALTILSDTEDVTPQPSSKKESLSEWAQGMRGSEHSTRRKCGEDRGW